MRSLRSICLIGFYCCFSSISFAQDLSGVWEGFLSHKSCIDSRQIFNVRLTLQNNQSQYSGVIGYYLQYGEADFSKDYPLFEFPISVLFDEQSLSINYFASQELQHRQFGLGYYIMGKYGLVLEYRKDNMLETLTGLYRGSNGGSGNLTLRRQTNDLNTSSSNASLIATLRKQQQARKLIQQKPPAPASNLPKPVWQQSDSLAVLYKQEQNTVQKMQTRVDSLFNTVFLADTLSFVTIELYDNAEMDGDTISLFVNDVLVMHKVMLSAKALQYTLYKPIDATEAKVRIVAENLGRIPPNTALAQVQTETGLKRFFMQSDEQSNGVILFSWTL